MSNLSRRDFLRRSAAGALGVTVMGVLGSCAAESAAFALEPQERPGLPALVLPGQPWERWIRLTFSAE